LKTYYNVGFHLLDMRWKRILETWWLW